MNKKGVEGFRGLLIAFLLIGLFTIALFQFGSVLQSENNVNESNLIIGDPSFDIASLNASLRNVSTDANDSMEAFTSNTPAIGVGELVFESMFSIGKTLKDGVVLIYRVLFGGIFTAIGVPREVVMGTLGAILFITIFLLLWRLFKTGR